LFLSLLFVLPSVKFVLKALLDEYCDMPCYLRRPADCSVEKLRRTFQATWWYPCCAWRCPMGSGKTRFSAQAWRP
jgi:hypothetical protein